ncbi:MAG: hypothetical protein KF689_04175 [Gemmatimonadaceae bacterium]|nr:hypothetical protein [Gemmatimonadaceae bacterium]MCW5825622.1 hypothetical protein [Gemmatimonadaceae bacterium]
MNRLALALPLLSIACGGETASTSSIVVDTLPGGIPRTMSSAPLEPGRWSLELVREIQPDADAPGELMRPQSLALADDGSVIVAESRPSQINFYAPDGSFVRTIGREGAGPGEFQAAFIAVRGDTLVVQDPSNARLTLIDWRKGSTLATQHSTCCYWAAVGTDQDGRAWLRMMAPLPDSTRPYGQGYIRQPLSGGAADTAFVYERAGLPKANYWVLRVGNQTRMSMPVPLSPQAHYLIEPRGYVLSGWSAEYSLRVSRNGRDTVAVYGRQWTPGSVTSAERDRLYEEAVARVASSGERWDAATIRNSFDKAAIPSARPAYEFLHSDEAGRR